MSVWSSFSGTIYYPKLSGISIRKLLEGCFENYDASISTKQIEIPNNVSIVVEFKVVYSLENEKAFNVCKLFSDQLQGLVSNARMDAQINIRWLS